jgi:hypothetical protein
MKRKKLFFCKDLFELADIVTKYVHDSLGVKDGARTTIHYPINFRVDDTPTEEEWDKMSAGEKKNAYQVAAGCYGIINIGEHFDADTTKLACCYYLGKTIAVTDQLDEDTSEANLRDYIYAMVGEATFCDSVKNILVQITVDVEKL